MYSVCSFIVLGINLNSGITVQAIDELVQCMLLTIPSSRVSQLLEEHQTVPLVSHDASMD